MIKRITLLFWMVVMAVETFANVAPTNSPLLLPEVDAACKQWVQATLARLSTNEKMGQLLVATLPATADKKTKKQLTELVKKYKVGTLLFTKGTPEEQAILTNLAQQSATLPVLVATGGQRLSDRLAGVPVFPQDIALSGVPQPALIDEYRHEVLRQYHELGMCDKLPQPYSEIDYLKELFPIKFDVRSALAELTQTVSTDAADASSLDERCRKVLTYKYLLGLHRPFEKLQVSGMSQRINTEAAQALALKLRKASIVALNNYFNLLPLTSSGGDLALFTIGKEGSDAALAATLRQHTDFSHFYLSANADEATAKEVMQQLSPYKRIVVCLTDYMSGPLMQQLHAQNWQAAMVYTCFAPFPSILPIESILAKANTVIVAHSAQDDVQQYVGEALFAKVPLQARLGAAIGHSFPIGSGCDILPGMSPATVIPEYYGLKSYQLQRIDEIARKGVEEGAYPGCRVLIMKDGQTIYDKGFGSHSYKDTTAVRPTDLFDLASLTKPMATLLGIMKLCDTGKLQLNDRASKYLPFLRNSNKQHLTIRELLLHESGLPPYIRFYVDAIDPNSVHGPYAQSWQDQWHRTQVSRNSYYSSDFKFKKGLLSEVPTATHTLQVAHKMWLNKSFKNTVLQQIVKSDLGDKRYVYSDLGFVLLQQVVETLSGLPLDLYVAREFYASMGLQRTLFLPLTKFQQTDIMPTACNDYLRRQDLCGYVHDETAAFLGGVAGNAGLFSTAAEVGKIWQMLLNGGEIDGKRYLSEATCRLFTTETSQRSHHGLGFEKPDASIVVRSACSPSTPPSVFGHTGLTGTCAWADPQHKIVYVFLSNRVCPNAWNSKLGDMNIRKDIQEVIYQSLKTQ